MSIPTTFAPRNAAAATVTRASDESLRQRLALAHDRIGELRAENQRLRDALAHAHGQLRAARLAAEGGLSKTTVHDMKAPVSEGNPQSE